MLETVQQSITESKIPAPFGKDSIESTWVNVKKNDRSLSDRALESSPFMAEQVRLGTLGNYDNLPRHIYQKHSETNCGKATGEILLR